MTGTWVGWVDSEMVLDDIIVSSAHSLLSWSNRYPYRVQLRHDTADNKYSIYGWNLISASLRDYSGPSSGNEDCAMSVWIRIADDNSNSDKLLYTDFGEAGDVCYDCYCIGVLGYRQQTGMVWDVFMATDQFPRSFVKSVNLIDTQGRSEIMSGTSAREAFLDGASVTVITSLLLQ